MTGNECENYARIAGNVNVAEKEKKCHHNINPDCGVCHKPVFWSRHLISEDRAWHTQCFRCSFCNKLLEPGKQSFYGSKLLCTQPCYNELFVGHNLPSAIKHLPKGEQNEHNCQWGNSDRTDSCMRCLSCERILVPGECATHDKFPYCKFAGYKAARNEQAQNKLQYPCINSMCVRCLKPVFAAEFCYSISYPWHMQCLRCACCDRILQPGSHAVHRGLPFCTYPCYNRIFSVNGFRRGLHECRP